MRSLLIISLVSLASLTTGCRHVTGYSDFEGTVRSANEITLLNNENGRPVPIGTRDRPLLRTKKYDVSFWIAENCIKYQSQNPGTKNAYDYVTGNVCASRSPIGLPGEAQDYAEGRKPASGSIRTDVNLKLGWDNWKEDTYSRSWTEHSLNLVQVTPWTNISRISATEHGSTAAKVIGWTGAVAAYLVGGALETVQLQHAMKHEQVNMKMVGAGGAVLLSSIPFIIWAVRNGNHDVTVYSDHPEQEEDYVQISKKE